MAERSDRRAAAATLAAALALALLGCNDAKGTGPGEVQGVIHHSAAEGVVFVTVEAITDFRYRLTSLDIATGKPLARRVVKGTPDCVPASPGRLWCIIDGLKLLDVGTLRTIADVRTLARSEPLLASGVVENTGRNLTADRAAVLTTGDGQHIRIDAATLAATKMGPSDPPAVSWSNAGSATSSEVAIGGALYGFRGRREDELQLLFDRYAPAEATGAPAEVALPAFLTPTLVVDQTVGTAALRRDPPAVLVAHPSSLIAARAEDQLSLLEPGGRILWTVVLGGHLKLAATAADTVVLILDAKPRDRAVAYDLATGAVRWQFLY